MFRGVGNFSQGFFALGLMLQKRATSASGTTNSCSGGLTVSTGHGAVRTTRSPTLPISARRAPAAMCAHDDQIHVGIARVRGDGLGRNGRSQDHGFCVDCAVVDRDELLQLLARRRFEIAL
jgi:hypothetical protein